MITRLTARDTDDAVVPVWEQDNGAGVVIVTHPIMTYGQVVNGQRRDFRSTQLVVFTTEIETEHARRDVPWSYGGQIVRYQWEARVLLGVSSPITNLFALMLDDVIEDDYAAGRFDHKEPDQGPVTIDKES